MIRQTTAIVMCAMLASSCAAWKEQWQKRYPTQVTSSAGEAISDEPVGVTLEAPVPSRRPIAPTASTPAAAKPKGGEPEVITCAVC